tara:strand:- start:2605 stop:3138 length:534 start_codon:yes stop_codon:yes gene_type:complete
MDNVILVDSNNKKIGLADKLRAHYDGLLHRAFSILIYNDKREFLLQRRSSAKYHTPNLWTNTCCSHPYDNESYEDAINRRLFEEMGMRCVLMEDFNFIYKASLSNNLIEYEHDTVFIGETNQLPSINKSEVSDYRYISYFDLKNELEFFPYKFTPWFKLIFDKIDCNFFSHKIFSYV